MVLSGVAKPPRLCRKFKTAAPVHKIGYRSDRKCAFYSSFESEKCVFAALVHQHGNGDRMEIKAKSDGTKSETFRKY